jgi:hypothetical protein
MSNPLDELLNQFQKVREFKKVPPKAEKVPIPPEPAKPFKEAPVMEITVKKPPKTANKPEQCCMSAGALKSLIHTTEQSFNDMLVIINKHLTGLLVELKKKLGDK